MVIIHSEGNIDRQTNNMHHKTHPEDTNNGRTVPQRAECEGTASLEDKFMDTNSFKHNRVFNPYTTGTQVNICHSDMQENMMPDQQIKGSVLAQI